VFIFKKKKQRKKKVLMGMFEIVLAIAVLSDFYLKIY